MSKVLFSSVKYDRYDASRTLPAKFERLVKHMMDTGMADAVRGKSVAVKMHVGRGVGYTTVHPLFVKILTDQLRAQGAKPFVTDQTVEGAQIRGYTQETLQVPVLDACGYLDRYLYEKSVDFRTLKHVDVAGLIHDADVMIDFSHVKGHGVCGYGGACKNIAMGCVSHRTRQEIHALEGGLAWDADKCVHCDACVSSCNHDAARFTDGVYDVNYHNCTFCQHCVKVCPTGAITLDGDRFEDFQTGMALATAEVLKTFAPGSVYYINFMTGITALCDCWGLSTPALVPDIGVCASTDIVAIEKACLDFIRVEDLIPGSLPVGYELGDSGHLFERIHRKDPFIQLNQLAEFGLGELAYDLEEID